MNAKRVIFCFLFIIGNVNFVKAGIQKIELLVKNNNFCGGHTLKLKVGQGSLKCSVQPKSTIERGQIITWSGSLLEECAAVHFSNLQQIYVQTSLMNALCPPENIIIVLDDHTTFSTIAQYTWYNRVASPNTNDADETGLSTVLSILSTNAMKK